MSKEINFDKVERVRSERCTGGDEYVLAWDFDALHAAYKETRRALEIAVDDLKAISGRDIWNAEQHLAAARLQLRNNLSRTGEARTEMAQEAMKGGKDEL